MYRHSAITNQAAAIRNDEGAHIRYQRRRTALAGLGQPSSAGASSNVSPGQYPIACVFSSSRSALFSQS